MKSFVSCALCIVYFVHLYCVYVINAAEKTTISFVMVCGFKAETKTNTMNKYANMKTFGPDQAMIMMFIASNENWIELNWIWLSWLYVYLQFSCNSIRLNFSHSVQGCALIKSKQLNWQLYSSISNWFPFPAPFSRFNNHWRRYANKQ